MKTEEMEKELDGKRYRVIAESIEEFNKNNKEKMKYEEEIIMHYSWKKTMQKARENLFK